MISKLPKYRVWDKTKNEMLDLVGFRLYNLDQYQLFTFDGFRIVNIGDIIFERYSGIIDEDGVEGCKNDVVTIPRFDYGFIIQWDAVKAMFYLQNAKLNHHIDMGFMVEAKIICSIHDMENNPNDL